MWCCSCYLSRPTFTGGIVRRFASIYDPQSFLKTDPTKRAVERETLAKMGEVVLPGNDHGHHISMIGGKMDVDQLAALAKLQPHTCQNTWAWSPLIFGFEF